MKVLIDTNVILDVLCERPLFLDASATVWKLCETKIISGSLCVLSIPNIVYILRKELDPQKVKSVIDTLYMIFGIEDMRSTDAQKAANMEWDDYEDALQTVCAVRMSADFIVTRNTRDYKKSPVKAVTPTELLAISGLK